MLLPIPQPYDFECSTRRFQAFGPDLANRVLDGALFRVVGGREVRIAAAVGGVEVEPLDSETRPVVQKLLGLEHDLGAFTSWVGAEPRLAELVRRLPGLRPPVTPDAFESLVGLITSQQVSLRSAGAIRNRLIERFGEPGQHAFAFPRRERLAGVEPSELVSLGYSGRKAEYVVGLARAELDLDAFASTPDEEVRLVLTAIRGLGSWTAEWFLARHLARPRAWPAGDLVLRKACHLFYGSDVHELGRRLDPFQNLSAQYLLSAVGLP